MIELDYWQLLGWQVNTCGLSPLLEQRVEHLICQTGRMGKEVTNRPELVKSYRGIISQFSSQRHSRMVLGKKVEKSNTPQRDLIHSLDQHWFPLIIKSSQNLQVLQFRKPMSNVFIKIQLASLNTLQSRDSC